jgi:hypothetical protein
MGDATSLRSVFWASRKESGRRLRSLLSHITQLKVSAFIRRYARLALGYWVSPYWYLFTGFVGLNLFQSAFTNWCPMMAILRKLGVKNS